MRGGIHVLVYMHVNVCTMIVQNDNAQRGGGGGGGGANALPPPKQTLIYVQYNKYSGYEPCTCNWLNGPE